MRLIHLGILVSLLGCPVQGALVEGLVGDEPVVESFEAIKTVPCSPPITSVEGDMIKIMEFEISAISQHRIEEMQRNTIDSGMHVLAYTPAEIKWVFAILNYSDSVENANLLYNLFWNRVNLLIHWYGEILESIHFDNDYKVEGRKSILSLNSIRAKYKPLGTWIFDTVGNNYRRTKESLELEKEIMDLIFPSRKTHHQTSAPSDLKVPYCAAKL